MVSGGAASWRSDGSAAAIPGAPAATIQCPGPRPEMDTRRVLLAVVLSLAVVILYNELVVKPRIAPGATRGDRIA